MLSPEFYAALSNRSILDQRFGTSLNKETTEILTDLAKWLRERINREGGTIASRKRYERLLADIEKRTEQIYSDISELYEQQFKPFAYDEADFVAKSMQAVVATDVIVESPSNRALWNAITKNPLQIGGNNTFVDFDDLIEGLGVNSKKIASVISGGYSQGLTLEEMKQAIVGTRAQKYSDGIIDKSRREAESIVRTSINHIASTSRDEVYKQNDDIVYGYTILATLDTRTTPNCRYFDGKTYRYSDKYNPLPPFHFSCRSQIVAEFYNEKLSNTGSTRSVNFKGGEDLKKGTTGQIDASKQYYDVLKRQPVSQQDAVLGKARGLIFRNAGLSAQEFRNALTDNMGNPLTLQQMANENKKILEYMNRNEFLSEYIGG